MNYADISGLSEKELSRKTKELREQLFQSRMKNALGQLTNPMTIRHMRRDIARLNTAMTAKLQSGAVEAKTAVAPTKKKAKTSKG